MDESVNQDLINLQNAWAKTEAASGSSIPDGDYVASLLKMSLGKSRKGRLQVSSTYKIADGNYIGKEIIRYDGLENEVSISYFKGYCDTIGFEYPSDITQLENAISAFIITMDKQLVNLTVKSKDGFTNIYVKGLVDYTS